MTDLAVAVRFLHLAAICLVFGGCVFAVMILRPIVAAASRIPESNPLNVFEASLHGGVRRVSLWALLLVGISAIAGLLLQADAIGVGAKDGAAWQALLLETRYGQVWLLRIALVVWLAALFFSPRRVSRGRWRLRLVVGATLAAALAMSGHAAADEGWSALFQIGADMLHLLAAAAWLGSLPFLAVALWQAARVLGAHSIAALAVALYSRLGVWCVSVLLVTGVINATQLVGEVPNLMGTPYGQVLLIKLSVLVPLLAIAWINMRRLQPAIRSLAGILEGGRHDPAAAMSLARNAIIETALGMAILVAVAYLGITPPARHAQPDWPLSFRWDWSVLDASPKARGEFEVAMMWLVIGALALELAWLVRTLRAVSALAGVVMCAYGLNAAIAVVSTDAYPSTYLRPEVPYQAISIAKGAASFERHCVSCHGERGRGDGPAGANLDPRPADLAARHVDAHTAGDLYWWIKHGKPGSAMAGFNSVLAEESVWDLVNLVRALGGGKKSRSLAPVVDEKTLVAAPDFSYMSADGESRALRDWRGNQVVLLVLLDASGSPERVAQLAAMAEGLRSAGTKALLVPRDSRGAMHSGHAALPAAITQVTEGNAEIHAAYALFAESFSDESVPGARHVEFLIDRQGYLRARWLPNENAAWRDVGVLLKEATILRDEPPRAPAPQEHVH
jgi:putative copper export protein/mono/diheme cytochrome c family protein/peroxiredoxin